MVFLTPLEQFLILEVTPSTSLFTPYSIFVDISVIFYALIYMSIGVFALASLTFFYPSSKVSVFSSKLIQNTSFESILYSFFKKMTSQGLALETSTYSEFIYIIFVGVLYLNLIGLFPLVNTTTSYISVSVFLSFVCINGLWVLGFRRHGVKFFLLFLPAGTPSYLIAFVFFLEIISFIARAFSLGIRLFANMLSGHILLKLLISYIWLIGNFGGFLLVLVSLPVLLVFCIYLLELAIAFLQAYVFMTLFSIYVNEIITL